MKTPRLQRAIVLTALPVEYMAVRVHLSEVQEDQDSLGTVYEIGKIYHVDHSWSVCICEIGAGDHNAAVQAERAINFFDPIVALFVGVAGGLKDVGIGDVVASTKVYGYESGKETDEGFQPRPDLCNSDYSLVQRARMEAKKRDWLARTKTASTEARALVAPIAAGEKVVASLRSSTYKFLRSQYGDAVAVEMEGRGFLQALEARKQVHGIVIRGISDLISEKANSDLQGSQELASAHAAAFAFHLLSTFVLPEDSIPKARVTNDSFGVLEKKLESYNKAKETKLPRMPALPKPKKKIVSQKEVKSLLDEIKTKLEGQVKDLQRIGIDVFKTFKDDEVLFRFERNNDLLYFIRLRIGSSVSDNALEFLDGWKEPTMGDQSMTAYANIEWDADREMVVACLTNFSLLTEAGSQYRFTSDELVDAIWEKACNTMESMASRQRS